MRNSATPRWRLWADCRLPLRASITVIEMAVAAPSTGHPSGRADVTSSSRYCTGVSSITGHDPSSGWTPRLKLCRRMLACPVVPNSPVRTHLSQVMEAKCPIAISISEQKKDSILPPCWRDAKAALRARFGPYGNEGGGNTYLIFEPVTFRTVRCALSVSIMVAMLNRGTLDT